MGVWLLAICYMLQIYFDFSGYSDMAIGLSRFFGFDFAPNFEHPYTAISVQDFWRKWHISLSRWFRDYLYIPLEEIVLIKTHIFVIFSLYGLVQDFGMVQTGHLLSGVSIMDASYC